MASIPSTNQVQLKPPDSRPVAQSGASKNAGAANSLAAPKAAVVASDRAEVSQPKAEEIRRVADELQKLVTKVAPELQFTVDESSGRSIIQVTDRTTNEVIRQIPSEEALQINKDIDRFQQGLLLKRKA